ncbi:MAG: cation-transporting P-type ATPase [Candidatus Moraniibacteriota bacterium]
MQKQTYNLTKEEVLKKCGASVEGLTSEDARERLETAGFNEVEKKQNWSWFSILVAQFNDALVWILLVAGSLAFLFGEYRDTTIILLIVGINALIGFFQEYRAEKTLEHIQKLTSDFAIVSRDGERMEIDAKFLVTGDIVHLASGDTVPADAYLLEGYDVYVNEFIFTGESKAGKKTLGALSAENLSLADMDNMLFMGTTLMRGTAVAVITQTGMRTQLGTIANLVAEVKEDETPLQKQMRVLGKEVTVAALSIGVLVLITGYFSGASLYNNFLFALALSVSVVPEGLPAAISVALSLGMKSLLGRNVLAKKLNAVETLASVDIICTDKTGTITRNELMVTNILCGQEDLTVDGEGYASKGDFFLFGRKIETAQNLPLQKLLQIGVLCNDADVVEKNGLCSISGDPTEGALLVVAKKFQNDLTFFGQDLEKIDENPFSSERMRMSVIFRNKQDKAVTAFVKGSPDVLLELCTKKQVEGKLVEFTAQDKERARNSFNAMSQQALRVLAFAVRDLTACEESEYKVQAEKDLVWMGMMGMIDPPRLDVHKAIAQCIRSGIKVIMITGDYEITAKAIARKVGLLKSPHSEVINGQALDKLSDQQLMEKIKSREVAFARIAPAQKLRIASALKQAGFVIAMTGDGVNDAPALKRADIGIAMGNIGTDVAKNAADMILLDDNFASIVGAIRKGRTIYQNLRKFVYYVFTSNVSEFFTVVLGVLFGLPAPITAVQILAIDLGTDIFPSFSLSLEPSEPDIMERKPFKAKEKIINKAGIFRLLAVGFLMAMGAVVAFVLSMKRGGWDFGNKIDPTSVLYLRSTTVVYAVLSMSQMANLLAARSEKLSVFAIGFFRNIYALGAIGISVGILLCFIYVPWLAQYLHMVPIAWQDWVAVAVTTLAVLVLEEVRKWRDRK